MVRYIASLDFPDVALGPKTKIDFIEVPKMLLPFRSEYACSTESLQRQMESSQASEQVNKSKRLRLWRGLRHHAATLTPGDVECLVGLIKMSTRCSSATSARRSLPTEILLSL